MTATTSIDPAIADFAARVRQSLDDLPVDEIEDLTEGLEADLTEKALEEELGDPEEYATELRSAAGLPARSVKTRVPWTLAGIRLWRAALAARIRRNTVGAQLLDFAIALRPAWWILRGWAVYQVALLLVGGRGTLTILPETVLRWVFFAALIGVSVQWGRGLWLPRWLRYVKVLVSVFAVLALPFLLATAIGSAAQAYEQSLYSNQEPTPAGLIRNGESVTNIFAYDANGEPLTGVQLFDQNGKPLSAKPPYDEFTTISDATALVPSDRTTSGNGWNVFPLESIPLSAVDSMTGLPRSDATTSPVAPPFARVQPLLTPVPLRDGSTVTPAP
ncbi:DUF1700 domain-containing protein [Lacisediminihabitans sp. FW035]